jgi:arginine exporter protein ArgO
MTQRSIGMMILLTIITFGIYGIYWYLKFQQELKDQTGEGFTWVGHLLLTLVTFGIYPIYWQYAAGKRLAKLGASDQSIIYLVLCFVALSWLNPFLMQSQANKLSQAK